MRAGIIILNLAALVWLAAALSALHLPLSVVLAVSLAASLAVAAICLWRVRHVARGAGTAPNAGRVVGLWSTIQGIAIAIAVFLLLRLQQPELIPPVVALIVGLHFIPLARGLRVSLYYWTGAGLIAVAAGSFVLPLKPTLATAGIGAAAVLYGTSFALAFTSKRPA